MRLSPSERAAIESAARDTLSAGSRVSLFGSRTDDHRRGGDIDLLVEPPHPLAAGDLVSQRTRFAARLYHLLGERRIDVLVAPVDVPDGRPVVAAARRQALENESALRRLTDQILFRFMKLQDSMGERLIPATLAGSLEPFEEWPMRDRLDRLEKLGFIDVEQWLQWRDVRNRLAHEYPDAPELRHAFLLAAVAAADELAQAYEAWKARLPG